MLADDVRVDVPGVNSELLCQQCSEPRRVESRARSRDSGRRNVERGRQLRRHVRHDIDRICRHQQNRIGGLPQDVRDHVAEHGGIPLQQLKPRLAGSLTHAGRDDDDLAAGQVCVLAR